MLQLSKEPKRFVYYVRVCICANLCVCKIEEALSAAFRLVTWILCCVQSEWNHPLAGELNSFFYTLEKQLHIHTSVPWPSTIVTLITTNFKYVCYCWYRHRVWLTISSTSLIHDKLFHRRRRILHWVMMCPPADLLLWYLKQLSTLPRNVRKHLRSIL
jgi:hypothetical protein